MNTILKVLALVTVLSITGSCAMIQKLTCNSNNATHQGARDASNGSINMPGLNSGHSCEGEYTPSQFQADYRRGFETKRNEICQTLAVTKIAQDAVNSGLTKADAEKKIGACSTLTTYNSLKNTLERTYMNGFCAVSRAESVGHKHGSEMADKAFESTFLGCEAKFMTLKPAYDQAYAKALAQAHKNKQDLFVKNTGTSTFVLDQKNLTASCVIPADQSLVTVTVNNPNASQTLVQGQWNYQYYDKNFAKIADDSGIDAVLLSPQSNKSFTKMTLPRNASFCRAEFAGVTAGSNIK